MPYKDKTKSYVAHRKWLASPAGKVSRQKSYDRAKKRYAQLPGVKEMYRRHHLARAYGLTPKQYDILLMSQKQLCACCQIPAWETGKNLAVDHCHVTGKIRGLLCEDCNRGLGMFKDSVGRLSKAIDYLQRSA